MPKSKKDDRVENNSLGKRVRVRCLGPGPEHTFWSTDPTSHRVCLKCRDKMRGVVSEYHIEKGRD